MTIRPLSLASNLADSKASSPGGEPPEVRSDVTVSRPRSLGLDGQNPADWPGMGPIDLGVHDLPHGSSTLEWWYMNGHVVVADGRRFSLFAAFFRQAKRRNPDTGGYDYAHSVTWALVDADRKEYFHASGVDPRAP
jgi:hypothetical protein